MPLLEIPDARSLARFQEGIDAMDVRRGWDIDREDWSLLP